MKFQNLTLLVVFLIAFDGIGQQHLIPYLAGIIMDLLMKL
jgi:hypothetical protein